MWLPETSFDSWRRQAWKPVSIKDFSGQKPSPSTMNITQMPATGAAALDMPAVAPVCFKENKTF